MLASLSVGDAPVFLFLFSEHRVRNALQLSSVGFAALAGVQLDIEIAIEAVLVSVGLLHQRQKRQTYVDCLNGSLQITLHSKGLSELQVALDEGGVRLDASSAIGDGVVVAIHLLEAGGTICVVGSDGGTHVDGLGVLLDGLSTPWNPTRVRHTCISCLKRVCCLLP